MHQRFLDAAATKDNIGVEIHPGTDHGYTWPGAPNHDEGAAARSWAATTAMFAAAFD
jgi:dienelactone hydrolase